MSKNDLKITLTALSLVLLGGVASASYGFFEKFWGESQVSASDESFNSVEEANLAVDALIIDID